MRVYSTYTKAKRHKTSNDAIMKVDNSYIVMSIHHYCICKMDGITPALITIWCMMLLYQVLHMRTWTVFGGEKD